MVTLQVIDDFYPEPQQVRDFALEHDFSGGLSFDGNTYPGTIKPKTPEFTEYLRQTLQNAISANVTIRGTAFVSSKAGELTEQWIHADSICAKWAAVIYLFDGHHDHGTALWRHKKSGCCLQDQQFYDALGVDISKPDQVDALVKRIKTEGEDKSFWQMAGFTEAKFNRLIVYPAKHFHSRYPRHSFGKTVETSRLIQVCFFDSP